ncbi:hypothetical protein [Myroides sp. N17-2]|uniref:hypothetical protein n=1 Tax=Myroides sp. N17-2 TaxID=2030799 RepID=UPI000EFD9708|nr:hypothetical protein [Myroides sp. N17-2]
MLFIENFEEAKAYHRSVLSCWLKIKLRGRKTKRNKEGYACGDNQCRCCDSGIHKFNLENKRLEVLLYNNVDMLLEGSIEELIDFYNDNSVLLESETLKRLFVNSGYEDYFQKNHGLTFLNKLNISTCVYCNRNYTLQLVNNHSRAQLDHWLPKTHFPFAALNFYNLIPSCPSCNHIKGQGDGKRWWLDNWNNLVHPYFMEETFKFSYSYLKDIDKLSVEIDSLNTKVSQTVEVNKIKEIYSAHNELELRDLFDLRKKYNDNYLNILLDIFSGLQISEEEKYRLIFGIEKNEVDYHKRPMSKFKNDIIEELMKKE